MILSFGEGDVAANGPGSAVLTEPDDAIDSWFGLIRFFIHIDTIPLFSVLSSDFSKFLAQTQ